MSPVDPRTELLIGGVWTDITSWVYELSPVQIRSRGRTPEQDAALEAAHLSLTVDNRGGRFSPRNPLGPWYGLIRRGTRIRFSIPAEETYLLVPGDAAQAVTAADHASLDVTGDLDVRIDADLETWRAQMMLAARWNASGADRSWAWHVRGDGTVRLLWTTGGTLATVQTAVSSVPVPLTRGRVILRATLDVNNGSGGWTVTFYVGDSISGPWTQLGDAVTGAGTTSIHAGSAVLEVAAASTLQTDVASRIVATAGRLYAFALRNGIGGTVVADPDFSAQTPGDASFADAAGRAWTVTAPAEITDRDFRFTGEISSLPQRWDISGRHMYVPLVAAGITRRLQRGTDPLRSTLYRSTMSADRVAPIAYWPCEDGAGSTRIASALAGGQPMTISIEQPEFARFTEFACSAPLPLIGDSQWSAPVPAYTSGEHQVQFLLYAEDGVNAQYIAWAVLFGGSLTEITLTYGTTGGGALKVDLWNGSINVASTGYSGLGIDARLLRVHLTLVQDGADVIASVSVLDIVAQSATTIETTAASQTIGRITSVLINQGGGVAGTCAIGHISVHAVADDPFDRIAEATGYAGETAAARILRLCTEQGISCAILGDVDDSEPMGPQRPGALVDLLGEAAAADLGLLYEPRCHLGLAYRPRSSLYNQDPTLELVYGADRELGELEPIPDDIHVHNDITATRTSGSSETVVLDSGPLSVPDVGRYEHAVTLNVHTDEQLLDQAGWRLRLGTVDEERYPSIPLTLRSSVYTTPATVAAARALDISHRLIISGPLPGMPPDDIDQLVYGLTETITTHTHQAVANTGPFSPYRVGVLDDEVLGRLDTAGSELVAGIDADDATMMVRTTSEPLWTSAPADFPFDVLVGGEVITVTEIQGADGTFESGVGDWFGTSCTLAQSSTRARSGTYSCLMTVTGSPTQAYFRPTSSNYEVVTPGNPYTVAFWAYSVAGYSSVLAAIDWRNSTGGYLSTSSSSTMSLPAGKWKKFTYTATAPGGSARMGYGPTLVGSPATGTAVYIDLLEPSGVTDQVFAVTRSVNGIVKGHGAGTDVRLEQPMILSL